MATYLEGFGLHVLVHVEHFLLILLSRDFEHGDAADSRHDGATLVGLYFEVSYSKRRLERYGLGSVLCTGCLMV